MVGIYLVWCGVLEEEKKMLWRGGGMRVDWAVSDKKKNKKDEIYDREKGGLYIYYSTYNTYVLIFSICHDSFEK